MSIRILNGGTPTPFPGALNAPTNVVASNPTSTSIDLAWTAPTQGLATEYRVRDNSDDSLVKTVTWPSTGTTISGLTPETAYVFYVVTSDGVTESPKSNTATETTAAAGPAPTGIYVDKTVAASALYDPATRTIGSGSEQCYQTIQAAVDSMTAPAAIYIRGAVGGGTETYLENVNLQGSLHVSGTSWVDECSMQSYSGEWAIVDGGNNAQYTIGKDRNGRNGGNDLAYWRFERLEITGGTFGTSTSGAEEQLGGAGLYISGGPFKVRFCYIHDNMAVSEGANPAGIVGYCWQDSTVEYCLLENNGSLDNGANAAHISIFSDYFYVTIATVGYTAGTGTERNEWKYNHFNGSTYGFKNKASQPLTGSTASSPYSDTYAEWGDKFHHNYFINQVRSGILCRHDFAQIYNNIIESSGYDAILIEEDWLSGNYKVVTYNNTIIDTDHKGINRYWCERYTNQIDIYHGLDYNNIFDNSNAKTAWSRFSGVDINLAGICNGNAFATPDYTNYVCSNNYHYRSAEPDHNRINTTFYTQSEYEAQGITGTPQVVYENAFDGGNLLFDGTTGADKYTTDGTHLIEGGVTVADGGVGGAHPWLIGVTFPSYVGAVDPSNKLWVDGVLNMDVAWLRGQDIGSIPTWGT